MVVVLVLVLVGGRDVRSDGAHSSMSQFASLLLVACVRCASAGLWARGCTSQANKLNISSGTVGCEGP